MNKIQIILTIFSIIYTIKFYKSNKIQTILQKLQVNLLTYLQILSLCPELRFEIIQLPYHSRSLWKWLIIQHYNEKIERYIVWKNQVLTKNKVWQKPKNALFYQNLESPIHWLEALIHQALSLTAR